MIGSEVASAPTWVGDATVWIGLLISLCTLIGIFYAFTRFAVKLFVGQVGDVVDTKVPAMIDAKLVPVLANQADVKIEIAEIRAQMHPNGGTSMRDSMDRISHSLGVAPHGSYPSEATQAPGEPGEHGDPEKHG